MKSSISSSSERSPSSCMEVLMRAVFQELMIIPKIVLTLQSSRLLNILLFLTIKQKELQSLKSTDLLPGTKLILGKLENS